MKSPGSSTSSSSKSKSKSTGKFPSAKALSRQYKAEARREDASARREEADASHRRAEAAHYQQEAAKAEHEGYKKEAEYDLARARREQAAARTDMAKARRNQAKAGRNKAKAAHAGLAIPGAIADGWILGGNDWHLGCAAVALANHLLAATGLRASDRDVLDLYWLTADDPDTGASVEATLEAAAEFGLGGIRPLTWECVIPAIDITGIFTSPTILDLRLQQAQRHQPVWDSSPSPDWGAHAALLAGDRVVTWGREVPVTGDFLAQRVAGAWQVEWAN